MGTTRSSPRVSCGSSSPRRQTLAAPEQRAAEGPGPRRDADATEAALAAPPPAPSPTARMPRHARAYLPRHAGGCAGEPENQLCPPALTERARQQNWRPFLSTAASSRAPQQHPHSPPVPPCLVGFAARALWSISHATCPRGIAARGFAHAPSPG